MTSQYHTIIGREVSGGPWIYVMGPFISGPRAMRTLRVASRGRYSEVTIITTKTPALNGIELYIHTLNIARAKGVQGYAPWEVTEMWVNKLDLKHPERVMGINDIAWEGLWNHAGEQMDLIIMRLMDDVRNEDNDDVK